MKNLLVFLLLFLTVGLFFTTMSYAALEDGSPNTRLAKVTANTTNRTLVNIGQVAMWIWADGVSANDPHGASGLFYPRGSTPSTAAIFQDGLIWGGIVNDGIEPAIRIGGQAYTAGTVAGAITSKGNSENLNDQQKVARIWRIRKDFAQVTDDELRQDASEFFQENAADISDAQIQQIRDIYRQDWIDWPTYKGAPFYDADGDGQYTPQFYPEGHDSAGWPILYPKADEPGYANGDQVVFNCTNDLSSAATIGLYGSPPIGMEMQTILWAYKRSDPLGFIIFKEFRVIYKGRTETPNDATIDSCFFCQWSDPDLGESGDDYAGCDTSLSLGYAYNATSQDITYSQAGFPPPASGYDFFAGPIVEDAEGEAIWQLKKRPGYMNLPMTSYAFFAAGQTDEDPDRGGPYEGTLQWWNLLRGFRPRPESPADPWTNPQTNERTMFRVPGDPVTGDGWIDENAGDRRILLVSGPFTMALGDTNQTVLAVIAALGSDRLSSISVLKFYDRFAQEAFDVLFDLPKAPPTPALSAAELNGKIFLNWAANPSVVKSVENFEDKGFVFEGYNVYQIPSAGASIDQGIKLATYDIANEVTTIVQETFEPNSGQILQLPVQIGKNSGINRTMVVTTDRFREKPLANGRAYFFAVSAYSFNPDPDATTKSLESTLAVVTVVPQNVKPGVRLTADQGDTLAVQHSTGNSDGIVTPIILDPTKLTGNTYEVTFAETDNGTVWNLRNVNTEQVVLANQENQSGDDDYLIIDGIQVKVAGPPPGVKPGDMYSYPDDPSKWGWDVPSGGRHITWSGSDGFEFEGFRGCIGWAQPATFWGNGYEYPATSLKPVLLKFAMVDADGNYSESDENVSYGYRYLRAASLEPQKPEFAPFITNPGGGYAFQGYAKSVPLSAWDISDPDNPRRLTFGHLENNQPGGMVDGKYWPPYYGDYDNTAGDGPREWLFIFDEDYSETPNPTYEDDITSFEAAPIMYWFTVARRDQGPWSADGTGVDQFTVFPNLPNSTLDVFTFTSNAPTYSQTTAKKDVAQVNVFPNPYYGLNIVEKDAFGRFVTFSHLPEKAVIRIFTLAGTLVRTLEKDSPSQYFEWNLQNEDALPVASGIYIAYIDMPDLGETKTLKLAVIREQQFLPLY